MSRKSLGTLTLDLVARTGGFVQGMSKAERESAKWRRQVERDLKKVSADLQRTAKVAAGVVAAGGAAIAAMTKKGLDAVSTQATLARSLDTTFDSVTALQLAFSDAGIDNFEASVNRLNRRLGAAELGRGAALQGVKELKLDLQELANVEADERLAIIADRIQEVSTNSQTAARYAQDLGFEQREAAQFFMQGGDAIRAYRKEVDDFGLALSAIDATKVELPTAEFQRTGRIFTAINQQLAVQVAPLLGSISGLLLDTARDAGGMGDAIESVFDRAVIAGINTASSVRSVFNQIQDSVEDVWSGFQALPPWAQQDGIAGALIGGQKGILVVAALSKAAEDTKVTAAWFAAMTEGDVGFYEWLTSGNAEAKERLKELGYDIDEIKAKAEGPSIIGSLFGPREDGDEWADEMIARYRRIQDEARAAAEEALESQRKLRDSSGTGGALVDSEGIEREISALERAAATWGMSANEVKLYDMTVQGATDSQLAHAQAIMRNIEAMEREAEARRKVIEEQKRIDKQVAGVLDFLKAEEERLADSYEERRRIIVDSSILAEEEKAGAVLALNERLNADMMAMEHARQSAMLTSYGTLFDSIGGLAEQFAGEQSGIARAMFAVSKAFAIADAIVKIQQGIASAAALQFPANIPAMASVAAATTGIVSTIQSTQMQGMAHDGIDSVPKTGTWLLEKGERVVTSETSAKLDRKLDMIQPGGGGGGITIHAPVTVEGQPGMTAGEAQQQGEAVSGALRATIISTLEKESRPGGMLWGMYGGGR